MWNILRDIVCEVVVISQVNVCISRTFGFLKVSSGNVIDVARWNELMGCGEPTCGRALRATESVTSPC